MIPTISDIVFDKFAFHVVSRADEFFVRTFTLINIAILNKIPAMNTTTSHAVKIKKIKFKLKNAIDAAQTHDIITIIVIVISSILFVTIRSCCLLRATWI